jgi:hypothetical protein
MPLYSCRGIIRVSELYYAPWEVTFGNVTWYSLSGIGHWGAPVRALWEELRGVACCPGSTKYTAPSKQNGYRFLFFMSTSMKQSSSAPLTVYWGHVPPTVQRRLKRFSQLLSLLRLSISTPSRLWINYGILFISRHTTTYKRVYSNMQNALSSNADVKNACNYTSTPPRALMVWYLTTHGDNFLTFCTEICRYQ